jgi:menaquinone-dependent protoporphyrinogen IX oxidase
VERHTVTYEGSTRQVAVLAQLLRDEGLKVDYEPPMESRGAIHAEQVTTVVISVVSGPASGLLGDAINTGVRKFRARNLRGKIAVDGEPVADD